RDLVECAAVRFVRHEFVQFAQQGKHDHDRIAHLPCVREACRAPDKVFFQPRTVEQVVGGLTAVAVQTCLGNAAAQTLDDGFAGCGQICGKHSEGSGSHDSPQ